MANNLVIVESPAKANTIGKFLGKGYKIVASVGHVRDLPKSQMGVDLDDDFKPKYITIRGKGDVIAKLKKEAKNAKKIYLATDPDREGEAISWHLAYLLNINESEKCRITFNEITKNAVKNSLKSSRAIDMDLVDAQQARRILDRIVGYKISPLLWKKVKKGLSAGRVQSVATRLICDREEEIENFIYDDFQKAVTLSNKHDIKILIVFGADWCPYCEELKRDIKSTHIDSIIVCFIDTDNVANKSLVARFRPRSLPTSILFYKDKEKQRKIGYRKKEYLKWVNGLQ